MRILPIAVLATAIALPVHAQTQQVEGSVLGLPNTVKLTVCGPGEKVSPYFQESGIWVHVYCDYMGHSSTPHMHQRLALTFNGAECAPWIGIIWDEYTVSVYCAPRS